MLNIIIKNRSLIKLFKYGKIIFKLLNRHLYVLSIFGFIARISKSKTFKVINWFTKIIIAINLIVASGLFISLTDFITPIDIIIDYYTSTLNPYFQLIKQKIRLIYNSITNLDTDTIMRYDSPIATPQVELPKLLLPKIDEIDELPSFNSKDLAYYASICFFAYFIIYLPGFGDSSAIDLAQYNYLNQGLIEIKMGLKELIINFLNSGGGNPPVNPVVDAATSVAGGIDSHSPSPFNTPLPKTPIQLVNDSSINSFDGTTYSTNSPSGSAVIQPLAELASNNPPVTQSFTDVGTQTINTLNIKRLRSIGVSTSINTLDIGVQTRISANELLDQQIFIHKLSKAADKFPEVSKLLKSIQLLDDKDLD